MLLRAALQLWNVPGMAQAPGTPAPAFTTLDDAFGILRRSGHRVSAPRRIVLQGLLSAGTLVTVDELTARLTEESTPLDTSVVYRNLETLEAVGLVRHVHCGHGPGRYAIAAGGDREYLACERCGAVLEVTGDEIEPVRREILQRFGYRARFTHFPILGLCRACQERDAA